MYPSAQLYKKVRGQAKSPRDRTFGTDGPHREAPHDRREQDDTSTWCAETPPSLRTKHLRFLQNFAGRNTATPFRGWHSRESSRDDGAPDDNDTDPGSDL